MKKSVTVAAVCFAVLLFAQGAAAATIGSFRYEEMFLALTVENLSGGDEFTQVVIDLETVDPAVHVNGAYGYGILAPGDSPSFVADFGAAAGFTFVPLLYGEIANLPFDPYNDVLIRASLSLVFQGLSLSGTTRVDPRDPEARIATAAAPEPGTLALLAAAAVMAGARRRVRQRR